MNPTFAHTSYGAALYWPSERLTAKEVVARFRKAIRMILRGGMHGYLGEQLKIATMAAALGVFDIEACWDAALLSVAAAKGMV